MIGHPTGTSFSRTIFIRLERKSTAQVTSDFNTEEYPALTEELSVLRRQLVRWAEDHRAEVKECKPDTPTLSNRARDNWRPLLKIAQIVGGKWTSMLMEAAGVPAPRNKKTGQEKLLRDLRNIFYKRGVDRIPSTILLADLLRQTESGWYRYRNNRDPLDVGNLADLMNDFNIGPKPIHLGKEIQGKLFDKVKNEEGVKSKGYTTDQLNPLFDKYLLGSRKPLKSRLCIRGLLSESAICVTA
jgi:hypothetical protein